MTNSTINVNDQVPVDFKHQTPKAFIPKLYDLLDLKNRPSTKEMGLHSIYCEDRTWWPGINGPVGKSVTDLNAVRLKAATLDSQVPLVIDLEDRFHFDINGVSEIRTDIRNFSLRQVCEDLTYTASIIQAYRDGGYKGDIAMYGMIPASEVNFNYDIHNTKYPQEMAMWRMANDLLFQLGILRAVNFTAPSLYTFGPDINQWKMWAGASIDAAKEYGKPVRPFLSPYYHPSSNGGKLAGVQLSPGMWEAQLGFMKEKEVDAVLWLGGDNNWKEDFELLPDWWAVTEAMIALWNK